MSKNRRQVNYTTECEFLDFLNHEFYKTARAATVEELAEFAFGSLKAGIGVFRKRVKEHETRKRD